MALPFGASGRSYRIQFTDMNVPAHQAWIDVNIPEAGLATPDHEVTRELLSERYQAIHAEGYDEGCLTYLGPPSSDYVMTPLKFPPITLTEPTRVLLEWKMSDEYKPFGEVSFGFSAERSIEDQERRALLANPDQPRYLRFKLECATCKSTIDFYDSLNGDDTFGEYIRLLGYQDSWSCVCNQTRINLKWLKQSLPALYRRGRWGSGQVGYFDPYRIVRLEQAVNDMRSIIATDHDEERMQKCIEKYPVFLNFLGPVRILHKPSILGKWKADFAVVTSTKSLVLIEIEKPQTKLQTRAGGKSAEVQKAFDQVREWRQCVLEHRAAVLHGMDIAQHEVRDVRYLVVAGVDSNEAAKIRSEPIADTSFITFEEMASQVAVMKASLESL